MFDPYIDKKIFIFLCTRKFANLGFGFDFFQGADIVVALTHMRWPNDRKVAREVDVDIVLGGHDHDYIVEQVQ